MFEVRSSKSVLLVVGWRAFVAIALQIFAQSSNGKRKYKLSGPAINSASAAHNFRERMEFSD